jgi:DNA polymerase
VNLAQARGSIHPINLEGGTTPLIATFHPRFLLQQPARKADAWADLRMLVEILTA